MLAGQLPSLAIRLVVLMMRTWALQRRNNRIFTTLEDDKCIFSGKHCVDELRVPKTTSNPNAMRRGLGRNAARTSLSNAVTKSEADFGLFQWLKSPTKAVTKSSWLRTTSRSSFLFLQTVHQRRGRVGRSDVKEADRLFFGTVSLFQQYFRSTKNCHSRYCRGWCC
jgi:hypothetical protein